LGWCHPIYGVYYSNPRGDHGWCMYDCLQTEQEDPNYASMLLLALMSCTLEILFGTSGVLRDSVPNSDLVHALRVG
jgi:hypothetical protein